MKIEKESLETSARRLGMKVERESLERAALRYGMTITALREAIGDELVYVYDKGQRKMVLVRRGSWRDTLKPVSKTVKAGGGISLVGDFFRFCMLDFTSVPLGVLWGLLLPITIPGMIIGAILYSIRDALAAGGEGARVIDISGMEPVYGGGEGLFDEVSTRRREDLQFLLGIGKYAE
jgi:hypothetical protein